MMKTKEDIDDLIRRAILVNLSGTELFAQCSEEHIREAYNGIGPDAFPAELREKITEHLALFEPAALIHDLRFDDSNGRRWDFNYANTEFHENCLALVAWEYSWLVHPLKRLAARQVAHILYRCVKSPAGWQAWHEASQKKLKKS